MKAVLLAGGLGTRLAEETEVKPKPMVEIGGMPILWHIMKIYSSHGINDFIICLGYKGYVIKEYFSNYFLHMSDVTIDMSNNSMRVHQNNAEPWTVSLVDTGIDSDTGGRLKEVKEYLLSEDHFCFTYGDGVADIDVSKLINFHFTHNKEATLTAARPPGRYGALQIGDDESVLQFKEKPDGDGSWINAGFFVLNTSVIDRIDSATTSWEDEPLIGLAEDGELMAYKHTGFWQPMDTLREKKYLNQLWDQKRAPWKSW